VGSFERLLKRLKKIGDDEYARSKLIVMLGIYSQKWEFLPREEDTLLKCNPKRLNGLCGKYAKFHSGYSCANIVRVSSVLSFIKEMLATHLKAIEI
jgi:hypothetical protein